MRHKSIDNAVSQINELFQRFENGLSAKRLPISERYFNNRVELLAELEIFCCGRTYNALAVLNRTDPYLPDKKGANGTPAGYFEVIQSGVGCYRDKREVFISYIKVMDGSEIFIPTSVRFHCPYNGNDILPSPSYLSLNNSCLKFIGPGSEREINAAGASSRSPDEVTRQQIKCGAQVMDDVSDVAGYVFGDFFFDPDNVVVLKRIPLNDYFEWIFPCKRDDLVIEVTDVAFRSLDF
ncbi:hypothetical protein [Klebsiella quasipneumoniae]|uniref:hypothetical protein n=1 Tax=Klebsiella quasipneumoniae TaxID=1463165 RepID=UPI0021D98FE3|nr:hypothetical protein [Klebsiella quasipneumoniae]MCU8818927.1 hypothetical protein [Klebsiella quasipneumoniae]